MTVSVLILTLNEEANLPRCLTSVGWSDDVVVLDCGSTDRTIEVAESFGARIFRRPFDDWATHLNWALTNIPFRYTWVFNVDADEVVTPELRDEMLEVAERNDMCHVAYHVRYKNFFMGRWLRHCGIYPTWILRFYRPEKVRWSRLVNPVPQVEGTVGRLGGHFEHHSFDNGLDRWFDKHIRYASNEAEESISHLRHGTLDLWGLVCLRDPVRRRRALKELSFRLPFRPTLRFLYMYFLRMGFLDGLPGYIYCRLLSMYEYMIVMKIKEIRRRERGLPRLRQARVPSEP